MGEPVADAGQAAVSITEAARQFLTFSLSGNMYAVGILNVKEILEYSPLTEVPMTPDFIRGVINLRGTVVPVIDLQARFGGRPATVGRRSCIIILEAHEDESCQDVGVLVDTVSAVLEISAADIEPPPAFGAGIRTDFIEGMGKVAGKFVILLNIRDVLSMEEIAALTAPNGGTETPSFAASKE